MCRRSETHPIMNPFKLFLVGLYGTLTATFLYHALGGDVFLRPDPTANEYLFTYAYYERGGGTPDGKPGSDGATPSRSGGTYIYYGPYRGGGSSGSSSGGSSGGSSGFHK
jgi:hypothetical protein